MKWLRNYEIRIKTPEGKMYTIAPDISVTFDIDRSVMSSTNTAKVTIYNLAQGTRNGLYKDKYTTTKYWQMFIMAGYGESELYEIFRGNIQEAYSYKKPPEWITEISAYDGAYAIQNSFTNETMTKDITYKDMLKRVIHTMPELLVGVLGKNASTNTPARGQVLTGPSYDIVQLLSGGQAFIDGETINILSPDEVIAGKPFVITGGDNGIMLETPRRREQFLEVNCLFSPEIRVGHICEIKSSVTRYNGQYKVYGIKHSGTFSQAQCGEATTMVSLFDATVTLQEVS